MVTATTPSCVVIVAGEASGDLHGSHLVRAIRQREENVFFCGIGGKALRDAGARILVDSATLSVMGITEVFSKLSHVLRSLSAIKQLLRSIRPELLILVDFPDFNLIVAKAAKKWGIPVLYYISPQVWAWRSGRVRKIRKYVDHIAVIFPFERDFYEQHGVPVTFVGHPLMDNDLPPENRLPGQMPLTTPVIGLLPGSRESEVRKHLPVMLDAVQQLKEKMPGLEFLVSHASSTDRRIAEEIIRARLKDVPVEILTGNAGEVLRHSHLVITASGTATLEAALYGVPSIIIYKVSPLSYWLARALVRVEHIGLVNLVAGEKLAPELIQKDATPHRIAGTAARMLQNPQEMQAIRRKLADVRRKLGDPGASDRTAAIALDMMRRP
ncbi:MAG: lipid-A-disaccharide synthase [Acidobacteria bacterium]|nr:lipid-A-disaccharide synthase [Acidobacteriota bacterium]